MRCKQLRISLPPLTKCGSPPLPEVLDLMICAGLPTKLSLILSSGGAGLWCRRLSLLSIPIERARSEHKEFGESWEISSTTSFPQELVFAVQAAVLDILCSELVPSGGLLRAFP